MDILCLLSILEGLWFCKTTIYLFWYVDMGLGYDALNGLKHIWFLTQQKNVYFICFIGIDVFTLNSTSALFATNRCYVLGGLSALNLI